MMDPVQAKETLQVEANSDDLIFGPWKVFHDSTVTGYSGLVYTPPTASTTSSSLPQQQTLPLIIFLHGAGKNERGVENLVDPMGEHAGLLPSLVATGKAPRELLDNFCILAPYSYGKRSFYEEPRSKLLQLIDWATAANSGLFGDHVTIDLSQTFLFGFSDGATLTVELLTTRRFAGGVAAAYGFTGILPHLALERLENIPLWVFHSEDDVIFPVACSDRLVAALERRKQLGQQQQEVDSHDDQIIRYTRFEKDPEGFTGSVRGHSTGITASKDPEVYRWLLNPGASGSKK